jgi:oxygen-independent coproporphyrinogen-3 oxidase
MKLEIHPDIILKYDVAGPRYTSYPPVPNFDSSFTQKDYTNYLISDQVSKTISLYFHFPFCKTLCYYCGCNTVITNNYEIIQRYIDYLKKEIRLILKYLPKDIQVGQLHWGGGTPNFLNNSQIKEIYLFIKNHFSFKENAEISIELDPRTTQKEQLDLIKELGFNRISFGVQDLNDEVQKAVNRIQPVDLIESIFYHAKSLNFHSINMDFIYGLPYQNTHSYHFNLKKILEWKPDRLAFFSYAHVPWIKKHQTLINTETLPNNLEKIHIFKNIVETLTDNHYVYIGLDHFAKPEDELSKALHEKKLHRNFQGYTVLKDMDVIAFGITGISQYSKLYARNKKGLKEYREDIDHQNIPLHDGYKMTYDDLIRKEVINQIMCNLYLDFKYIEEKFNIDFHEYFVQELKNLKSMEEDELISIDNKSIKIEPNGRPLIRNVAMAFDIFLRKNQSHRPVYSRTI